MTKINNLHHPINNKISRRFQLLENQREKVINKGILSPRDFLSITLNLTVFSVTMSYNLPISSSASVFSNSVNPNHFLPRSLIEAPIR